MLRKSIENFIKGKDNEISDIKGTLGALEEKLMRTTLENEMLLSQNQELNQSLNSVATLNYEQRIQQLSDDLEESENSRKSLQERLKESDSKLQSFFEDKMQKEIDNKVTLFSLLSIYFEKVENYCTKYLETKAEAKKLTQELDEQLKLVHSYKFENTNLKLKVRENDEISVQNVIRSVEFELSDVFRVL